MKRTITSALVVVAALSLAGCDRAPKKAETAKSDISQSSALLFSACDIAPAAPQRAAEQNKSDTADLRASIVASINGVRRAKKLSQTHFAATGFGSDIFTGPGWPVNDVREALKPAIANIALNKIVELKKEGLCLEPLNDTAMRLLASTVAGIDPQQPDESFQRAMDTVDDYFTKLLDKLDSIPTPEGARAELARRKEARAAALADGKATGTFRAQARLTLPAYVRAAKANSHKLQQLLGHDGFSALVGLPNPYKGGFGVGTLPFSSARGASTLFQQIKDTAFLTGVQAMKGTGPVSEREGLAAEKAIQRMSTALSENEFMLAAQEYVDAIARGVDALRDQATMDGSTPVAAP